MTKRAAGKSNPKRALGVARGRRASASASAKSAKSAKAARNSKKAKASARKAGQQTTAAKRGTTKAAGSQTRTSKTTCRDTTKRTGTRRKAGGTTSVPRAASRLARPTATSQDPIQFQEEVPQLPRTSLSDKELGDFRDLLLRKRAELTGDVERLTEEALNSQGEGRAEHSAMPIHMADLGSDNWEQEFTLGLIANEQALVREIDAALERIAAKTYGVCLATGKRITKGRLRAKPWAKYCIEYARAREEGRAP